MPSPTATDPILTAERDHLIRARECLGRMRARADRIADYGVDALASEALGAARVRRLRALADDPTVPPFFGRVDRRPDGEHLAGEVFHIGRRHVRDDAGDPLVIDWRAPMARPFYRATAAEPLGLRRRRRFGFATGRLTSYEDEPLDATAGPGRQPDGGVESRILLEEIERPRVGPMRDIVATIQPDQDDLVRASLDDSICVQGAPGTGKTAVGLHRAAYLLYTYPDRLRRSGVLVVGPNRAFLSYIGQVLPALGEVGVGQQTIEQLLAPVPVRGTEPAEVATLKGDARMAEVLRRAVYGGIGRPQESVMIPVGTRRYRVPPERLRRYVDDLRRGEVRYLAARDRLHLLVAEDLRRQREAAGGAPSDRETARVARSAPVRAFVEEVWPAVDAAEFVFRLLADPDALAAAAAGLLDLAEQRLLSWPQAPRSARAARWTQADAVLIDEVAGLLERPLTYGHVVLDEAQDLSPMQCRGVARRCPTGSITVLGDLAQGTTPWAASDWPTTLAHLGKAEARVEPLTRGYRVPADVIALANRLLPHVADGLNPATSVRRGTGGLRLRGVEAGSPAGLPAAVADEVSAVLREEGSVGVIVADAAVEAVRRALTAAGVPYEVLGDADRPAGEPAEDPGQQPAEPVAVRVSVVPATLAKGLEFDSVVVAEPAAIVAAEPRGLRRLYVVLTRAVSRLVVVHQQPLPPQLSA
jgi:DNA helicase IV